MENENVKLTPEQLEYYRKTNPKYFSQIISYYSVNDPTYYRSVVEPFLINLQKANKKKNRNIVIIVSLILVIILIIGYIRSQDPEFQKKMEVEKKEKELKAQQDVQNKKDEEQKKIAAEKEKKDQQAANENPCPCLFSPQELANTLWSLAKLGHYDVDFVNRVIKRVRPLLRDFSAQVGFRV